MTIEQYEAPPREVEAPRHAGALALDADQTEWTSAQQAALVQLGIADAPKADQQVFMHVAQRSGLDPFARQIYLIGRNDQGSKKWTIQTAIDGFRVIAGRNPNYAGQTPPQWCDSNGQWVDVWLNRNTPPSAARIGVFRHDSDHVTWGVVHFWEFAGTKRGQGGGTELTKMWSDKGAHMIAKVAEATALRKAFPQDFSGLYIAEEMEGGDSVGRAPVRARAQRAAVSAADLTGDTNVPQQRDQAAPGQPAEPITRGQSKQIGDLFTDAGVPRADRLAVVNQLASRKVEKPSELTVDEAESLIGRMTEIGPDGLCRAAGIEIAEEEPHAVEDPGYTPDPDAEWAAQVGGDQ